MLPGKAKHTACSALSLDTSRWLPTGGRREGRRRRGREKESSCRDLSRAAPRAPASSQAPLEPPQEQGSEVAHSFPVQSEQTAGTLGLGSPCSVQKSMSPGCRP